MKLLTSGKKKMEKQNIKFQNEEVERSYKKLVSNLEEITKFYRNLLDLVRKEREKLVSADIQQLEENNQQKEQLLMKIKLADTLRAKHASEFASMVGGNTENPRLLELAQIVGGKEGDHLRSIHSALEVIIQRITMYNKENEEYAKSALQVLSGAMSNIKETLGGKKTYEKGGQMKTGPNQAGNFVSKEA